MGVCVCVCVACDGGTGLRSCDRHLLARLELYSMMALGGVSKSIAVTTWKRVLIGVSSATLRL